MKRNSDKIKLLAEIKINSLIVCFCLGLLMSFLLNVTPAWAAKTSTDVAKEYSFSTANYSAAAASKNYLKMELQSTQFFFLKKTITGFVKAMTIRGDFVDSQLRNAEITFEAQALDTGHEGINRDMLKEVFHADHFNQVVVRLGTPIQMNGAQTKVAGNIEIRGSTRPIELQFTTKESHDSYIVDAEGLLSLTTMNIKPPMPFLTKIADTLKLDLHFDVKKSDIKTPSKEKTDKEGATPSTDSADTE